MTGLVAFVFRGSGIGEGSVLKELGGIGRFLGDLVRFFAFFLGKSRRAIGEVGRMASNSFDTPFCLARLRGSRGQNRRRPPPE